jgi:hypothetical protein
MHLMGIIAIIYVIYKLIQEKIEDRQMDQYAGMIFDSETYLNDQIKGINPKRNIGKYYIDPKSPQAIVDKERYEYDKSIYCVETMERRIRMGEYLHFRPIRDFVSGCTITRKY